MKPLLLAILSLLPACLSDPPNDYSYGSEDPDEDDGAALGANATCGPTMSVFPVVGPHNIGYDSSCNDGTCDVSCTGERANSDYGARPAPGGFHHGNDVFAHRGADLVAVAAGHVVYAKLDTNGSNEVKIVDACGWSYFYGHLESFAVRTGDDVVAGQKVGTMGNTGTGGVHLHFNASPGAYSADVDPLALLQTVEPTACGGGAVPPPPPPPPGCGALVAGDAIATGATHTSCSGAYTLKMQNDGNLVLYPTANQTLGSAVWDARVFGPEHILVMQSDGNLVVYASTGAAVWDTHTNGHPGAYAQIGEGTVTVRGPGGNVLWSSR